MIARRTRLALATLVAAAIGLHVSGDYDLPWFTIDGGGGSSSGSGYELNGTIGQCDAGVMSGGSFTLQGGFWNAGRPATPSCPGDVDGDGFVDVDDMIAVLGAWGPCVGCAADIDGSGAVDTNDLLVILAGWGTCR